jgi:hypothetical protein
MVMDQVIENKFTTWFETLLQEKGVNRQHVFEIDVYGDLHVIEMDFVIWSLFNQDNILAHLYKAIIVSWDVLNKPFLKTLADLIRHILEYDHAPGICSECEKPISPEEWEDRHTPHEPDCGGEGCDCDLNVHGECCTDCKFTTWCCAKCDTENSHSRSVTDVPACRFCAETTEWAEILK